jgi:GT2 family glycosyltransferase
MMPTVIIPVLNNPHGLVRCISAILQEGIPVELIIVDNGSTDETREVARRYTHAVLCCPGLTIGAMRNQGAKLAKGQIFVFIDSDQEPGLGWLASGLSALLENESAGLIGSRYHAPPNSRWVARIWDRQRRWSNVAGEIGWLESGNLFARRDAFESVGGFRTDLVASEDVDLSFRMRKSGYQIICDPRIVNYHHGDPQTLIEFFRKERWRGSSGWRAWAAHGFTLSELPSLFWPIWVGIGLPALLGFGFLAIPTEWEVPIWLTLLAGFMIWTIPAMIRASQVTMKHSWSIADILKLMLLYFVFGIARFVAITNRKTTGMNNG